MARCPTCGSRIRRPTRDQFTIAFHVEAQGYAGSRRQEVGPHAADERRTAPELPNVPESGVISPGRARGAVLHAQAASAGAGQAARARPGQRHPGLWRLSHQLRRLAGRADGGARPDPEAARAAAGASLGLPGLHARAHRGRAAAPGDRRHRHCRRRAAVVGREGEAVESAAATTRWRRATTPRR